MNVQDLATRVSANLKEDKDPAFDPFTIIMIVQLIIKLIAMMQECEEKPDVTNPTRSNKAAAIKNIRANLPWGKKMLAKRIFSGIMDEACACDHEEIKKLVDQTV